jgi:hypothetical protein
MVDERRIAMGGSIKAEQQNEDETRREEAIEPLNSAFKNRKRI